MQANVCYASMPKSKQILSEAFLAYCGPADFSEPLHASKHLVLRDSPLGSAPYTPQHIREMAV